MDRRRLITIIVAAALTVATLVALAAIFELTRVPSVHFEIGWVITMVGWAIMAWKLRASILVTLIASAAFILVVRYTAFTVIYALLESAILLKLFA
jgi:hypothetical protein